METGKDETPDSDLLGEAGLEIVDARAYGKAMVHILARQSGV
jgi:hypothetical protein